jgi:23S rRNA pseudouridine1911/1915/1917 synthase
MDSKVTHQFLALNEHKGLRLDHFLTLSFSQFLSQKDTNSAVKQDSVTRAQIQKMIEQKCVTNANQQCCKQNYKVREGDSFFVAIIQNDVSKLHPVQMDLDIVYEDEDLLVLNKSANVVVHPGSGNREHTLVHGLLYYSMKNNSSLSFMNESDRPGIVHRLDKDTTGLLVVAKNNWTHHMLAQQFNPENKDKLLSRRYKAFVVGKPANDGIIKTCIGRHPIDRKKMAVIPRGKFSETHFLRIGTWGKIKKEISLLELHLKTGRTHQIRVHLQHIRFPIFGDLVYGGKQQIEDLSFPRQALHAFHLSFLHPRLEKRMEFEIPFPEDMDTLYKKIKIIS